MTPQRIFNKAARHLLKQNKKSEDFLSRRCMYRGPNGLKCAVGCLIPDSKYVPNMEDKTVYMLINMNLAPLYFTEHFELLRNLQKIHDTCDVNAWRDSLQNLATMNKLKWQIK